MFLCCQIPCKKSPWRRRGELHCNAGSPRGWLDQVVSEDGIWPTGVRSNDHLGEMASLVGSQLRQNLVRWSVAYLRGTKETCHYTKDTYRELVAYFHSPGEVANGKELVIAPQKSRVTLFTSDAHQSCLHPQISANRWWGGSLEQGRKILDVAPDTHFTFSPHSRDCVERASRALNFKASLKPQSTYHPSPSDLPRSLKAARLVSYHRTFRGLWFWCIDTNASAAISRCVLGDGSWRASCSLPICIHSRSISIPSTLNLVMQISLLCHCLIIDN